MDRKKIKLLLTGIIAAMFTLIIFAGADVEAKTVTDKDVKIDFQSTESVRMTVKKSQKASGVQVGLKNSDKKVVSVQTSKSGILYFNDLKPASIYYYEMREYTLKNGKKQWGEWSALSAFSTSYADFKPTKTPYSLWLHTPKAKGVVKYEIWMSTGYEKGYSKIGTVNAGKTIYMSKFKGTSFRSYKTGQEFYVFLKPVMKSGSTRGYYSKTAFSFNNKGKLELIMVNVD